jgi:hypothetical protein
MPNFKPVSFRFRGACAAAVLAFGILHSAFGIPASSPAASVVSLEPTRVADLVLLDHGFDAGLREGMICRVTRGMAEIAELQIVAVRPGCSAALITSVAAKQSIRAGDVASIKILKT